MLLREILNLNPLHYKWISPTIGSFEFNNHLFGIVIEESDMELPTRIVSVANISFGVVINTSLPISMTNLDRQPTNFGQPRTVIATVAEACINNPDLSKNDMFVVAASDQVKHKRIGIYALAIMDLTSKLPLYKYSYRASTTSGSILVVTSKIQLSQDETNYIGTELLGKP